MLVNPVWWVLGQIIGSFIKNYDTLSNKSFTNFRIISCIICSRCRNTKKIYGSGTTTLTISNNELNDIIKIVQALEDHDILLKEVTKTVKSEVNNQKGGFLGMLMGTLCAALLGNILSGMLNKESGIVRAGDGILKKIINFAQATSFNKFQNNELLQKSANI